MRVGRIVDSWKILFANTDKDSEQFLLTLKDHFDTGGIQKDYFVPYLLGLFTVREQSRQMLSKFNLKLILRY